MILDR